MYTVLRTAGLAGLVVLGLASPTQAAIMQAAYSGNIDVIGGNDVSGRSDSFTWTLTYDTSIGKLFPGTTTDRLPFILLQDFKTGFGPIPASENMLINDAVTLKDARGDTLESLNLNGNDGAKLTIEPVALLDAETADVSGDHAIEVEANVPLINGLREPTSFDTNLSLHSITESDVFNLFAIQDFAPDGSEVETLGFVRDFEVHRLDSTGVGGVPEPTTWGLMLLGFFGAGAGLRARRSALSV